MALYFMGARTGESRKTGDPYYCVDILHKNRWGSWSIDPAYVDSELFSKVEKMNLVAGSPITIEEVFGGDVVDVLVDDNHVPLELE